MHRWDSDVFYVVNLPLENHCGVAKWNSLSLDATSPGRFHETATHSGYNVALGTTTNPNFVFVFLGEGGFVGAVDL
jgi:hypothetical protein